MTALAARFIAADHEPATAPQFRREFQLDIGHGEMTSAVLTMSALGICTAWINGTEVSADLLTPGWTSYEWRVHTVSHDVASLIPEQCALGILVGNGWYRGRLGWVETRRYGSELAAYAYLLITFEDGHQQHIVTDETWAAGPSAITFDDLYDGQSIDGRLVDDRWKMPGFASDDWAGVHIVEYRGHLTPDPAPPVRRIGTLAPKAVWRSPSGKLLADFGENIVGFLRVQVHGEAGTTITVRHAEVLDGGELALGPLRSAECTDRFTLSGKADVFEPTMTFHGFRYAQLDGWPGEDSQIWHQVVAVIISSDLRRTGHFECSVPELNQLHSNIARGMRGNFVDIPTDCPQRDERLGWTGDIAAFAPTAAFLFDVKAILGDWLADVALEQASQGGVVPYTVPDILKYTVDLQARIGGEEPAAFWSDAAVWVPWALWEAYGDKQTLENAFESMLAHGRRVRSLLSPSGVWDQGFQLGDWLDPDTPADRPGEAKADPGVVATACAYRTARRIAETADILKRLAEAQEFSRLARELREAFHREYVGNRRITSDCATVYSLAITFGLLDDVECSWAGARLAELVARSGYRISTGFVGTPFVTDALSSTGQVDTAYALLLQTACPSWLYPVTMGATTVWERWDAMLPDGSINDNGMTSFNHYALGAVADWMHRVVGGVAPLEPGYAKVRVAPLISNGIDWARTTLTAPQGGVIRVHWERSGAWITLHADVPEGVSAEVCWPGRDHEVLPPGTHTLRLPAPSPASAETLLP